MPTAVLERPACQECSTLSTLGVLVDTAERERLCQDCVAELDLCFGCDLPARETAECADGAYRCAGCRVRWSRCDDCHRYTEHYTAISGGGDVCEDCARTYNVCTDCEVRVEDYNLVDGERIVCQSCADSDYQFCADDYCDTLIAHTDHYCDSCARRHPNASLWHSDYKPDPIFHGTGPLHLGLELELHVPADAFDDAVATATATLGDLGYLKDEASVSCGFELVTHPMSYDYAISEFPWSVLPRLRLLGAFTDSEVGIHIHLSRAGFDSPAHIYRWLRLIYRNDNHVTVLARRESQWAMFTADHIDHRHAARGNQCVGRYQAVNTLPRQTFELRIFGASLYRQQVQAAFAFAHASVEYTRHLTIPDILTRGGWTWQAFTAWAADRAEYAPLTAELATLTDIGAFDHLTPDIDADRELACAS
ncbi:hypothetical protein ACWEVD_00385 [Nocardia thailandica]